MSSLTGKGVGIDEFAGFGGTGELAGSLTAVVLPSIACKGCYLKAQWSNTGYVYIGASTVTARDGTTDTTTGFQLSAGEITPFLRISNLNQLYLISTATTDCLTYYYET